MPVKWVCCSGCRRPAAVLWRGLSDEELLCRECLGKRSVEMRERLVIPEGSEMRMLYWWWMRLTGRISDAI